LDVECAQNLSTQRSVLLHLSFRTINNYNAPPAPSKITHIPVGNQPEAIDLSPDTKEVWVGLNADLGIDVVDTATYKTVERIKLGERPYRVVFTPDGKQVMATIPNTKELVLIDVATRKEVKRLKLDNVPIGI
jgi:DNA-binding beta-propeller fold protein YncE